MKITVLTPNYNGGRWLARCMDSVLAQELAPGDELEYLFLDGGSTDDSLAIAEARRARLAALVSEKDAGPADALNKGFARATGELVGWLNADDVYRPGALAKAIAAAKAHPRAAFFFGKCHVVSNFNPVWARIRAHGLVPRFCRSRVLHAILCGKLMHQLR